MSGDRNTAFGVVCDLEEPLYEVETMARLLVGFSLDNDDEAAAMHTAAWDVVKLARAIQKRRMEIFHLLRKPAAKPLEAVG